MNKKITEIAEVVKADLERVNNNLLFEMDLKPQECIFVGDSGMDCATAVNSGCYPLGVLWGFRKREELILNGAKTLISNPNEIVPVVKEMLND